MHRLVAIICLLLSVEVAYAQFTPFPWSAHSGALGGVHSTDTAVRRVSLGYRHGYGMTGMATRTIDVAWALGKRGRIEAGYSHFGDRIYHEQQVAVGYNIKTASLLTAGVRGRYLSMATGDAHYETQRWLAAEAVVRASLGERLTIYAEGGSRQWDEAKPWMARIGLAYNAVEGLTTVVELDSDERARMRFGAEYCFRHHYFLRAGMATNPTTLTFGIGAQLGIYGIDLAVEGHEYLGLTPHISLSLCP